LKAAVKIYDVKFCGELKVRMLCDNPDALNLFNACSELKLPVIIHLDYDPSNLGKDHAWYGGTIESFERAIKACPDTCFLGHAPGFWKHISGDSANLNNSVKTGGHIPRMLRLYDNLYCDISAGSGFNALNRDHEFAIDFLTEFQDRIVFARDCFDNKHQELIKSLLLPDQVTSKIFSKNITKLLSI
jgi:predicted TIM-barrel fold metal-dependent hydrolase